MLSSDSLFHCFRRLDIASVFTVRLVCHEWSEVMKQAWLFRTLDVEELCNVFGPNNAIKRFALLCRYIEIRPAKLKLSPNVLAAQYLSFLKFSPLGDSLREIDMTGKAVFEDSFFCYLLLFIILKTGVSLSNADLCSIPKSVFARLRSLHVAPEDDTISILSIAPLVLLLFFIFLFFFHYYSLFFLFYIDSKMYSFAHNLFNRWNAGN
jgi:hypothetical protein